jgi:predicted ATPase
MIVRSVEISDMMALRDVNLVLHPKVNCFVGINGSGKTTMLNLIAGVCGNDDANHLLVGKKVGRCRIVIEDDGDEFVFEASDYFRDEALGRFKRRLPSRANYTSASAPSYVDESVDFSTARTRYMEFLRGHGGRLNAAYSAQQNSCSVYWGSAYRNVFGLMAMDTEDSPFLIDNPDRSLDVRACAIVKRMLIRQDRQLIYATHSPEMMVMEYGLFDLSSQ